MRNNRSNLQHICEEGCVAKKRRSNLKNICEEGCVAKKNWSNLQNICEEGCVAKTLVKFAEYLRGGLCGEKTVLFKLLYFLERFFPAAVWTVLI